MQALHFYWYGYHIKNLVERTMDNKTKRKKYFQIEPLSQTTAYG